MDTKGGKPLWGGNGGVLNWAIGIDIYTLMCIKLMTNTKLQYKKQTNKNRKKMYVLIAILLIILGLFFLTSLLEYNCFIMVC